MSIGALKYNLLLHLKNIPGPTVNKKLVVFECDDFGGIRMPSTDVFKKLEAAGTIDTDSRYNQYDTIESKEDLMRLFKVLSSVKDKEGNAAVFSPFVNMVNPDFDKIKACGYQQYFYEPFTATYQKYGRESTIMDAWKEGIDKGIFLPQFHGREHLAVQPWMQYLRDGHTALLQAFQLGFVSVSNIKGLHPFAAELRPEFYFTIEKEKEFLHQSIRDGVQLFNDIFGYKPFAFAPGNSLFHPDFEKTVAETGVRFLNVAHKNPYCTEGGNIRYESFTFKQKIKKQPLNYYIRNCAFEPNDPAYQNTDIVMTQIAAAFHCNKPAIISTHRVNFAGSLFAANRDKGLKELQLLLQQILKCWPDAIFAGSKEALSAFN